MAVDFSLLPKEEPEPGDPPSLLIWTIVFLVMALACAIAILLSWPRDLPTHTWKFWASLILFPVGIPAWIVLRRYSHHEGHRLDVLMRNEVIRRYNERVFALAARPLALLGAAHRFSSDQSENATRTILSGKVTLETQKPIASDSGPTKARWLVVPGVPLGPGGKEADARRHREVTRWLYSELLADLANRIQSLPSRVDLSVCLWVSGGLLRKDHVALWQACWREHQLRDMRLSEETEPAGLDVLDGWLDQLAGGEGREARLIVAIQLYPVLSKTPPVGAAEAGVALLLMPGEQAGGLQVVSEASLHRPVRGPFDQSDGALSHAVKWGDIAAAEIPGGWQTGLDATQAGVLREAAVHLGLTARPTDLDQTVGHAGTAAPWLAIACAAGSLSGDVQSQIVFAGQPGGVDSAVVRSVAREKRLD
ncbi:hypothetical protein [Cupriavidus sp. UME77]|uniref:hypothetical protein n=1 Tax=Cupriavidus sp. UME77 TaxID=1862321 RepID=UPI0016001612|nr:hypothetical protein [Cupriavidus sp. UME77]MBB1634268.1 hypothetical protein [Cupriavidus sp. UME77]